MAVPQDDELRGLLGEFVCVRLVQMWNVDLSKFQFDYALTWSVFFMHGDGTILGRYGTRSGLREQSARDISLAGFKAAMRGAKRLHKRYVDAPEETRPQVAGKQTQHPPKWNKAEEIPFLARNKRLARPFVGTSKNRNEAAHGVGCIHCHFVPDHEMLSLRQAKLPIAERLIWPYPMPYAIGLRMAPRQRSTIQRVFPKSAAAKAGLKAADQIEFLAGQAILSTADIQWVLHNSPGSGGKLSVGFRRDGEARKTTLELTEGWRRRLGDWRFINLGVCMRIAAFRGRPTKGGAKRLAIKVQLIHRKRLAEVDLRRNDLIVAIDGVRKPMNLGQLTRFLLAKEPGSEIEITRLRNGEEKQVRYKVN